MAAKRRSLPPRRAKVALVSTGGTIAMEGRGPYDWVDYAESGIVRDAAEVLAKLSDTLPDVPLEAVPFRRFGSTAIGTADWLELAKLIARLVTRRDIAGVVVTHGTATLEETAWMLALTVATRKPIVLTGAQRPPNTAGSDAAPNLRGAILAAAAPALNGLGVMVVMDNRIHDARSVTKLANHDLDAFQSPESGPLGRLAADGRIVLRRRPMPMPARRPWRLSSLRALPRVDIVYSYAGADGVAVKALVAAGARGIVLAGLPPGRPANRQREALAKAARAGVAVVLASRAINGIVEPAADAARDGFLNAGDLSPLKARILLMLALSAVRHPTRIQAILDQF
ncbi:MAG TPA: asparaginase [Candidatus Binataceae bacterium]|nr:asparaginase [Candidatus Binataceae bacterium]